MVGLYTHILVMTPIIREYTATIRFPDGRRIEQTYLAVCHIDAWIECVEEHADLGVKINVSNLYFLLVAPSESRLVSESDLPSYPHLDIYGEPVMALTWLHARHKLGLPFASQQLKSFAVQQKEIL